MYNKYVHWKNKKKITDPWAFPQNNVSVYSPDWSVALVFQVLES